MDYLSQTKNILVTSGYMPEADYSGKITEVDYQSGHEVFEATFVYKTLNGIDLERGDNRIYYTGLNEWN